MSGSRVSVSPTTNSQFFGNYVDFCLCDGEELNLGKLLTESKTVQLIENNKKIRKSSDRVSLNRNRQSLSKIETVM